MRILAAMTVHAILRRILEIIAGMAAATGHVGVRADQLERRLAVVERGWLPRRRRVTLRAGSAKCAVVCVLATVAIHTVLRGALEHAVDVASSAGYSDVRARQLESGSIVIEGGRLPALRRVTLRAVGAELAVVRVVLAMAIYALLRRALEELVGMTSGARCVRMLSHQLESGLAVIECRGFPPDRRMALGAL